jgi:RNA polymerase sigma-70 factor (ECF subfamily)
MGELLRDVVRERGMKPTQDLAAGCPASDKKSELVCATSDTERRGMMGSVLGQTTTHASLLARLSGNADKAAWVEFHERYADLIRGFARRRGVQPADCDDILQDVMMSLTKSMPGFAYDPAKGKFRSYLKTVVIHAIVRRSCQKKGDVPLESEGAALNDNADEAQESQWESEWRQYHLRLAMKTILVEFNRADVSAFERYALGGEDARTTAAMLHLSVEQVFQAKSRILRRLSALIDLQVQEEG